MDNSKIVGITLRMSREELDKIRVIATQDRRTATSFIRCVLQDLIAKHEAEGKVSSGK